MTIRTALMSVTDKEGLASFAKQLRNAIPDLVILASGGTARHLNEEGVETTALDEYTEFKECFGGRLKTLHPKIMGGILYRRGIDDDDAEFLNIMPIDLVVCNLYDFQAAAEDQTRSLDELIEQIDIGGSTLIRSASKNHQHVTVVVNPFNYPDVIDEIQNNNGETSLAFRQELAVEAMNLSADYDSIIANELCKRVTDEETARPYLINGKKLRYGENPDQEAWVYHFPQEIGVAQADILSGKALSFNNYDDATIAVETSRLLNDIGAEQGIAIIKHGNLCACATGKELNKTFNLAWEGDSKSAFGSIIAFTSTVCETLIPELKGKFIEVLIAPEFTENFIDWAKEKRPSLRLLKMPLATKGDLQYKKISGGMLIQTPKQEAFLDDFESLFKTCILDKKPKRGIVTKKAPTENEKGLISFAIATVTYAKSNAITIVREVEPGSYQLLGVGSGQPNRVDSLQRLAIPKAIENLKRDHQDDKSYDPKLDLSKCVLASDGFFPFDDSIRIANEFGIQTCVQPGGSNNDEMVIKTADELQMSMIFTGERYFSH